MADPSAMVRQVATTLFEQVEQSESKTFELPKARTAQLVRTAIQPSDRLTSRAELALMRLLGRGRLAMSSSKRLQALDRLKKVTTSPLGEQVHTSCSRPTTDH